MKRWTKWCWFILSCLLITHSWCFAWNFQWNPFKKKNNRFCPLGGSSGNRTARRKLEVPLHAKKKKSPLRGLYFEKTNHSSHPVLSRVLHATSRDLRTFNNTASGLSARQLSDTGWRGADAPSFHCGPLTFLREPPSSWHNSPASAPDRHGDN